MKAITIHQPWASLIAHGYKRFETRSWRTHYRGPIAIHAGKRTDMDAVRMIKTFYPDIWRELEQFPIGCIVAVGELKNCREIYIDSEGNAALLSGNIPEWMIGKDSMEFSFGWYENGRYAWELANVRRIDPIQAKGQQGLWNWEGVIAHEER